MRNQHTIKLDKIQKCLGCGREFEYRYASDYCFPCMNSQSPGALDSLKNSK